jgi:hypothetical protein
MDSLFKVPGTKLSFGLNPFLDVLPVFGDGAAAVVSALTLIVAGRYRVPKVVMVRMALNILLNAAVGVIPGVGEAFAIWFRPSTRNYKLLHKHMAATNGAPPPSTHHDWLFVAGLTATMLILFFAFVAAGVWTLYMLLHWVFKS